MTTLSNQTRYKLIAEFSLVFLLIPVSLFFIRDWVAPYIILVLLTLVFWSVLLLLSDRRFKRFRLWNLDMLKTHLPRTLKVFVGGAIIITLLSWYFTPEWLFFMPIERPWLWFGVLLLYPLISAWPQELIFRTFMFHRYKRVFRSKSLRAALSATSFALAHLVFANWFAVIGSFFAGLVFSFTYIRSRSTLLVAFEHSLWGCWLFTSGLGVYFDSTMVGQL